MDNDQTIEQAIVAKGLTAPRVTPQHIEDACSTWQFHVFPGSQLTVCCLTLRNGFTVTGESACASPENFDAEIGERIALANAKQKVWALEGYLLKQALYEQHLGEMFSAPPDTPSAPDAQAVFKHPSSTLTGAAEA